MPKKAQGRGGELHVVLSYYIMQSTVNKLCAEIRPWESRQKMHRTRGALSGEGRPAEGRSEVRRRGSRDAAFSKVTHKWRSGQGTGGWEG